ncbi:MAG: hypothetical protein WC734_00370 [Patescibacteria group bacterium]|jgi:hypothetical protein
MINTIKRLITRKAPKKRTNDFSEFFHKASSAEKKKLISSVVREANQDQRDLVEKYHRSQTATQ